MSQPEAKPMTCPVCAGPHLSPETVLHPSGGVTQVMFAKRGVAPSLFRNDDRVSLRVDRARVCLQCGFVLSFLSAEAIHRVRAEAPSLEPMAHIQG